jgi:hypothetical protein
MTSFQNKENVMKNQDQANNNKSLNDPNVANAPQAGLEFDDLPISGEQEEQVIGGAPVGQDKVFGGATGTGPREESTNWVRVGTTW